VTTDPRLVVGQNAMRKQIECLMRLGVDKRNSLGLFNNPVNIPLLLLLSYFFLVIIRFSISLLVANPLILTDELSYKNIAYSFFKTGSFYNTLTLGHHVNIPNVLYPFLISPSFCLLDNFYVGMKLINSFLINASIFPVYLLSRELMPQSRSLFVSFVVLLLPHLNFINFIAVDGLNLTLFMFCFLFAYRTLKNGRLRNAALWGLCLALLLFNKPSAFFFGGGIVLTFCIDFIYSCMKRRLHRARKIFRPLLTTMLSFTISFIILSFFLTGKISYELGLYKPFAALSSASKMRATEVILMMLAHVFTFLSVYFVPFFITLLALFRELGKREDGENNNLSLFLVLGFSLFTMYLLGTAKFMMDIYDLEHFDKLHARYYFMTYPFFIIAFAAFTEYINWNYIKTLLFFLTFILLVWLNNVYFFPKYVTQGLNIFGNPDVGWAVPPASMLYIVSCFSALGVALFYFSRKIRSAIPYLAFFVFFMVAVNYGEIRNLMYYAPNSENAIYRHFIQGNINNPNAAVVLIDSGLADRLRTAFWLPYNYTRVYDLPKGSSITKDMIPSETEFVVLFDQYQVGFPSKQMAKIANCSIYSIR
jgi:hypothetical protein